MKNFVQPGNVLDYTIPSATTIEPGDVVVVNDLLGVAAKGGTTGDVIPVYLEGVYELDKTTGTAHNQGDVLYWNSSTDKTTKTATGNKPIGYAFTAAASGATSNRVLLAPLARTAPIA
jgi:predicted RecA/RadA family phage recombinase